jgi:hypothetical protein
MPKLTITKPWTLRVEEWLFYVLLRRYVKRLSISDLESWLTWFELDKTMKRKGLEHAEYL